MTIKTFHPKHAPTKHEFYIQSRGLHSGRPLKEPIPNSFVVILSSQEDKNECFHLVQALYENKAFQPFLIGSVVPMIRISDVKAVIRQGISFRDENPSGFKRTHKIVTTIDLMLEKRYQEIETLKQLKVAYLNQYFNGE